MSILIKAISGVLIAVIFCLTLSKHSKDLSLLLVLIVSTMVVGLAIAQLAPVVIFFEKLQTIGNLDRDLLNILLKAVGIGLLSEICALICNDAGNAALGKAIKMLAAAIILCISIPLFEKLIEFIEDILVMT